MKKIILTLLSVAILAMAPTANAVEPKVENGKQLLVLTEAEYQSIKEDPYKLFSEIWGFEIGKKIPFENLKSGNKFSPTIPADLAKEDTKLQEKLSMLNVFAKEYYFTVVVDGKNTAHLRIFSIGDDEICFSYRFETYRQGEVPIYRKDPILELTDGNKKMIDIKLPSGNILKSVRTENYVQGLYVDRFDEIFRNIYPQINRNYELAIERKAQESERLAKEEAERAEIARVAAEQRAQEAAKRAEEEARIRAIEQAQAQERVEKIRADLKARPVKSIVDGFRGIPWGIAEKDAILLFGLEKDVNTYLRKDDNNSIGNVSVGIRYDFSDSKGFYQVRLLHSPSHYKNLAQELVKAFGKPTVNTLMSIQWELKGGVRISMSPADNEYINVVYIIKGEERQTGGGF